MTGRDEILDEVRAAREAYWSKFDNDLDRVIADLKEKESAHPERLSKLKPVQPRKRVPAEK
jgi:hypothetical protein